MSTRDARTFRWMASGLAWASVAFALADQLGAYAVTLVASLASWALSKIAEQGVQDDDRVV